MRSPHPWSAEDYRRGRRVHRRTWLGVAVAVAVGALAAGAALTGAVRSAASTGGGEPCDGASRPLRVVAAPEIAGVVADLVRATAPGPGTRACPPPVVTAVDPADVADAIAHERGDRPDVWIPDSSIWINRKAPAGRGLPPNNPSLAYSPIVAAVPEDSADALGWPTRWPGLAALLPAPDSLAGPVRFTLPESARSAATVGLLLGLQATTGAGAGRAELTSALRAALATGERWDRLLLSLTPGSGSAVPATEQQVWASNVQHRATRVVAAYPPGPGYFFDYPYVVLASDHVQRVHAQLLLGQLTGELGRQRLLAAGFRDATGAPGLQLTADAGVDRGRPGSGPAPDADAIDAAVRIWASATLSSRILAVLDVSGSMDERVPGAHGATKLDLALAAAANGLALYPDDTVVGLWTFATNLSDRDDYRQLVPTVLLGRGIDGSSGRERMAQALSGIRAVHDGGTGLYDTALAAVRAVRKDWDPARVNSVVLLTDGHNDDPDGISLDQVVATLRAENDPSHPVFLITIAYGADSDRAALTAMSRATGAEMYVASDPRRIREVMLDAIGRRACRPNC